MLRVARNSSLGRDFFRPCGTCR